MEKQEIEKFQDYGVCELHKVELGQNCLRYYRIEVMPGLFSQIVARFWGRIGQKPRCKEDFCENLEDGIRLANSLYRQKKKRGYEEIGAWTLNTKFQTNISQIQGG